MAALGARGPSARDEVTVRIVLAGDVMLGRGMAAVVQADGPGILAGVRHVVSGADVAAANLESPLTRRRHTSPNPNALEALPAAAAVVAAAGFDVLSIANNHAGDAGPGSVVDTIEAVTGAGMQVAGGGRDSAEAERPAVVERAGVRIAFLAYDATHGGMAAGAGTPGIARWDVAGARRAVAVARDAADVVIVSLHGGVEYLPGEDPAQWRLAEMLASWGVDVVWGHGPHVLQPVSVIERPDGRVTLVATSLGNLVFDQRRPGTTTGGLLEVLAGPEGVHAYRLAVTEQADGRVRLDHWALPDGDAVT